jgi:2-C-methyl-D-erythritol 4-phosphate cytidylyltransferase
MNVILLAAGSGKRFGGELPKQYLLINDKPVLYYSLKVFECCPLVKSINVVISKNDLSLYETFLESYAKDFKKLKEPIFGGNERRDSVFNAMSQMARSFVPDDNLVAIHDSARPLLSEDLLIELYNTAYSFGASAPALSLTDTVKEVDENGFIVNNPVRDKLKAIQTPQIFNFEQYWEAIKLCEKENIPVTDDSETFFRFAQGKVKLIDGDFRLFKITYKEDIERAEKIINKEDEWNF